MSAIIKRPSSKVNAYQVDISPDHTVINYAQNHNYAQNFSSMIEKLSAQPIPAGALSGNRPLDDMTDYTNNTAIALLDSWAITNDIIAFYQERLLNEGYLSSIQDTTLRHHLLSLVGYANPPSIAATVDLAFQTKPSPNAKTVIIPKGLQIDSHPTQQHKAVTFECDDHTVAHQEQNVMSPALDTVQIITSKTRHIFLSNKGKLPAIGDLLIIREKNDATNQSYHAYTIQNALRIEPNIQKIELSPYGDKSQDEYDFQTPEVLIFSQAINLFGYNAPDFKSAPSEIKRKLGYTYGGFYHFAAGANQWVNLNKGIGNIVVRNMAFNSKGYGFIATNQGVFRSFKVNAWGSSNKGINTTDIRDIATVDQTLKSGIIKSLTFAATDQGVYLSDNYGMQWNAVNKDLKNHSVLSIVAHALSTKKSLIIAGTEHGAFYSKDEGQKWHACHGAIEKTKVYALVHHDNGYFAATSHGVFHSKNGHHWKHYGRSLDGTEVRAIAEHGDYFYAATANGVFRRHKKLIITRPWEQVTHGMKNLDIRSLCIDKKGTVYAGTVQGLYCSTNHGKQWFSFGFEGQCISALSIDLNGLLFSGAQYPVTPAHWPNFHIQNNQLDLPRVVPNILKGNEILLSNGTDIHFSQAQKVAHIARQDFMLKNTITRIETNDTIDPTQFGLRNTQLYYGAKNIPLARSPLAPFIQGQKLILSEHISTLQVGQKISVQGHMPIVTVQTRQEKMLDNVSNHKFFLSQLTVNNSIQKWDITNNTDQTLQLTSDQASLTFIEDKVKAPYISEIVEIEKIEAHLDTTALTLTAPLQHLYSRNTTKLCGNIASATQGKTIQQTLGSGKSNIKNQRFTLSHSNVLSLPADNDRGYISSLNIYVNDILWTHVDSLFNDGIDGHSTCYMSGYDENGRIFVIFGDGHHGALLPTGHNNVIALYKIGNGAEGNLNPETLSSIKKIAPSPPHINPDNTTQSTITPSIGHLVRSVTNPLPASGGTAQKTDTAAHDLIPLLSIQSLFDAERLALQAPSIALAKAIKAWDHHYDKPIITLNVAGAPADPTSDECTALQRKIMQLSGLSCAVKVVPATRVYFSLSITIKLACDALEEQVIPACRQTIAKHFAALPSDIGNTVTRSNIISIVQSINGVQSVTVQRFCSTTQGSAVPPVCETKITAQKTDLFNGQATASEILMLSVNNDDLIIKVTPS